MNLFRPSVLAAASVLAAVSILPLRAAEADAAAGRALVKRYADAIVGIELVVTMKMKVGDREQPPREQRIEVNGTVISESGLTVTSLAMVDPQSTYEQLRASQPSSQVQLVGADFKEVKLRLADGTELPARFVLKDADLDLAFMAPEIAADGAKRTFPHVKLDSTAQGAVLGNYFVVGRESKALQRVPNVRMTQITAIVEKPRRIYLLTQQSMGTPVMDAQGEILGISVQYFANGRPTAVVVMPAADIAEMARQAVVAQAKPSEPKPAETPPAN